MGKRLLGTGAVLLVMLLGAANASATTGSTLTISSGTQAEHVSVAVDSSGDAIAAWADNTVPGANLVGWCVLAPGGSGCSAGGSLAPAGGPAGGIYVDGTQVLVEGSTIVILADLQSGTKTEYESVQEWQSTDGGHSFGAVNGGKAVASGNTSADTQVLNAVTLPGSTYVGVGFDTAAEAPTFHAFSLTNPTLCGRASPTTNCADGYATLAPSSDPDQVSNVPGNFAANSDGILGVYRTNTSSGDLGCPGASPFGMAYVFGDGLQSPSNNYNVSPGQPATAWRKGVTLADCGVDYIAVGGGPSGFGVLEDNQVTRQTQYHHFNGITNSFDTVPALVSAAGEQQPAVSQDSAGGVYATYLSGGIGGPVSLSYSADGGTTWSGPGALAADPLGRIAGLTSAVDPSGQGWAAWTENGAVFAQQFNSTDAVVPTAPTTLATSQKAGSQAGTSISVPAGTVGETDQATIAGASAARAAGTMTYTLYSSATCGAASALARSTTAVAGPLAPASTPVAAALAPGKYYWQASYSGNPSNPGGPGNAASTSACGSEVLTVTAPNTIAAKATTNGRTLTFGAACAIVPCTLQVSATAPATAAKKATAAQAAKAKGKRKPKALTLGKGKFLVKKKGTQKLTLKLSSSGRRYFASKHGKVKVTLVVTEKIGGQSVLTKRAVKVKISHR